MRYLLIFLLCLQTLLWAKTPTVSLSPEEEQWIQAHPVISVANDPDWAPFDFTQDGKAQGLGIDYLELVAQKVGLKVNYVHAPWFELFERFKYRNIDLIHSVYKTNEREKFALFTQPFYENTNALAVRKGLKIDTVKDLEYKRIALIKGHGISETIYKEIPSLQPVYVDNLKEALHAVSFNKADAVISSLGAMSYIIMQEAISNLDIAPASFFNAEMSSELFFATNLNKPILRTILNKGLQAITPQEHTAIRTKWLLTSLSIDTPAKQLRLSPEENAWLKEHETIRFTGRVNYLPFEGFKNDGTYVGILADYLDEIEKLLSIEFIKQPSETPIEMLDKLNDKKVDILSGFKGDTTFDKSHIAIKTNIKSPIIIVGQNQFDNRFITNLSDLQGNEKIAVLEGFPYVKAIKEHNPHLNLIVVKDIEAAYNGVIRGEYAYMLSSLALASYKINELSLNNLQIVGNTGYEHEMVLFIPKEWSILSGILEKIFDFHIREFNEAHAKTMQRWESITLKPKTDYSLFVRLIMLLTLTIGSLFYWNYLLKRRVNKRTAQFKTLLATFDTHIIASRTDMNGFITYVSDAFCTISGYTREELIGQKHSIVKHPDSPDALYAMLWNTISQGKSWHGRLQNRNKLGQTYWIENFIQQEVDEEGKPLGYIGIMRDVSAQVALEHLSAEQEVLVKERTRELAELNQEQQAIVDTASVGIVLLKHRKILNCNHHLNHMLGYEDGEQIGAYASIWYESYEEWVASKEPIYTVLHEKGIHTREQYMVCKDGRQILARITLKEIDPNDEEKGVVGVIEDITFEKAALAEVEHAKQLAEEATRTKSNFLANMSHEIRTPMNAMIGMTHLLFQTSLNSQQKNYLEKIDNAAKHLLNLINDILDFSKIESGKMMFETIDFHLDTVLEQLSDLCAVKAQEKGLELLFDIDITVPMALRGDPLRLGQILINLVNNAIKFTPKGEVTIRISTMQRHEGSVVLFFEINDTGIGMSLNEQQKLFQAFSQADISTTRRFGGSGLGLAICKHFVEMMNGTIGVKSELGKGSTFFFDATFELQHLQKELTVNKEEIEHIRILVVDDNESSRLILANMLTLLHFDVATASNGEEALTLLQHAHQEKTPYTLVLMDWMMPHMSGIETIQKIRSMPEIAETLTFIMITSYSKEALKHELEHNAIHNILIKPINPSLLLDTILSAFGKGAIQQPLHTTTRLFHKDAMNALKGASILLVEDNIINQEMALEILEKAGLHVDVANNGYEALLKVRSKEYDGVLMDCQMPIIDGFEATRLIREEERFKDLPILAMTANAMAGDKERCLQCGMNDHIAKPIDVAKLFMTMAKYIFPKHTTPSSQDVTLTEKTAVLLPTFTTLNTKDALARVNHDAAIFFKLLNRFAHKESDVVQRIEILIASHHYDDAIREAHTLKGLAGTIGANALMESASTLEQKLKATPHNVQDDLETLQKLLFGICEEIEQKRSQIEALLPIKELSAHELQTLKEQCHTLIALLKDLDPDAGDLFDILLPQLRAVIEEKELKTLAKLIHDFHYDEAILIFEKYPSLLE